MAKDREIVPTTLECKDCGNVQEIQRKRGSMKKEGHIKSLWCFKCKSTTYHKELKDKGFIPNWVK